MFVDFFSRKPLNAPKRQSRSPVRCSDYIGHSLGLGGVVRTGGGRDVRWNDASTSRTNLDANLHVALSPALEGQDFWSARDTRFGPGCPPRLSRAAIAFPSVARMLSMAEASTALGSR